MKTGSLFFIVVASAIIVLLLGSETVRWLMAGALAVVALPLWKVTTQAAERSGAQDALIGFRYDLDHEATDRTSSIDQVSEDQ